MSEADSVKRKRLRLAHGGSGGSRPIRPLLLGQWRPGMPCHWMEQTAFAQSKFLFLRVLMILQSVAGVVYMQYRARKTIGFVGVSPSLYGYQMFFLVVECFCVLANILKIPETWNAGRRNCVDFKHIPNDLLDDIFSRFQEVGQPSGTSNYPSVAVYIPCYNEGVDLVEDTILAALNIDYPLHLLSVYLCDDGQDEAKRDLVLRLRKSHQNLHYVVRPEHKNAKAGNLNYALARTNSDLVVTLDADFIARPNMLQRMLPYFYVWDPFNCVYEFNDELAAVQAPQHFRNLSPYDSDPLGQRESCFSHIFLPGKDWFNAATLIGTTNVLSRKALEDSNLFPYHSVTEDSALSLILHRNGYRTYFVNESLATGLATTSLWSNFDQRERWLKGDFQVLFSKDGPLTASGLSLIQRMSYLNMSFSRFVSIACISFDVGFVLFLVFGIPFLNVRNSLEFLMHLFPYFFLVFLSRFVRNSGGEGLHIADASAGAFEVIFRYMCVKGLIVALLKGKKIKFKVTDKSNGGEKENEAYVMREDVCKNLRRTWINFFVVSVIAVAIFRVLLRPSSLPASITRTHSQTDPFSKYSWVVSIAIAFAFAVSNLLPNMLVMYLCFVPYISGWMLKDVVHGRCDQYAIDPDTGKKFVPWSYIGLFSVLQAVLIFGSLAVVAFYYT